MLIPITDIAPNPLIQTIIEIRQEVEPEKPKKKIYTIQEKIDRNHYKCDEAVEYIRADNAKCLSKPIQVASSTNTQVSRQNTPQTIKNGSQATSGWYPAGQCTWLVSTKRAVGQWGNATDWLWQAQRDGYATGSTPRAGAIAWRSGHVAFVESVNGNRMVVSEANYDYNGSIRTIEVPVSSYSAFIY